MGKFHHYSFNNALLITSQCPHASYVTSYSTWKNNFNRIVRKGEKAIRIIAPCPYKTTNKKTGEEEDRLAFRAVSVFDISQTIQIPETDEIPFKLPELTGNVPDYDILIRAVSKSTCLLYTSTHCFPFLMFQILRQDRLKKPLRYRGTCF